MEDEAMRLFEGIMTWIVVPLVGVVWLIYQRQQDQRTDIEVLKSETVNGRIVHDREIKEIKETNKEIFKKLDSIEQLMRR